ncbi:MAG: PepSY domain-containing protein [Planctomycetaceae bacterium]
MSSSPSQLSEPPVESTSAVDELDGAVLTSPAGIAPETTDPSKSSLYRIVWRWHFYAGLFVSPILLAAAVTGALYVFHAELSDGLYADLRFVEPVGMRLSYDEQRQAVLQAAGGTEPEYLTVWPGANRATQWIAHRHEGGDANPEQRHQVIYIDPYSGEVLGTQIMEEEFFHAVLDLHRTLFAGPTGRVVVELATSWGLVLLITGAYLWWPRNKNRIRGVWIPRWKAKPYVVLRDLHAVCGIYVLAFAAIVLATGLFVSQVWGTGYMLASVQAGQSLGDFFANAESEPPGENAVPASLETAVSSVLAHRRSGEILHFGLAATPTQAWKAYLMHDDDTNAVRGFDVDQYTGKLISVTETAELTPMVRILALAVSLHQGKTFGLSSKIVAFVTCLALIGMIVTGLWMWWKRRPDGGFGFPQRPRSAVVPKWVWLIVALVGVSLPTVGVSMLLIVAGERFVRRGDRD